MNESGIGVTVSSAVFVPHDTEFSGMRPFCTAPVFPPGEVDESPCDPHPVVNETTMPNRTPARPHDARPNTNDQRPIIDYPPLISRLQPQHRMPPTESRRHA
jgi:hypothetical protein